MALSLPAPPSAWDRTLPNPASLLPNGRDARRSSSLLQHHISSDQFSTPAAGESVIKSTFPYGSQCEHEAGHPDVEHEVLRQRQESIMSAESSAESVCEEIHTPDASAGYCLCIPDPKIPRPRNAFILYRQSQHGEIVKSHPGLPNPDISKIIGEQWRRLSPEEKDKWRAFAEQEKARHSQQFPDYRYRPKRSGKTSSETAPHSVSQSSSCSKCGGKTMNPPQTPHYSSFDHSPVSVSMQRPQKRPYSEAYIQPRAPSLVQIVPQSPFAAPIRYGFQPRQNSVQFGSPPHPHSGSQNISAEPPDPKRRRMNTSFALRPLNDHQYHERERQLYANPEPLPRYPMPPPPHRTSNGPPSSIPARNSASFRLRSDPSLTLPPLRTSAPLRPVAEPQSHNQSSSTEAMIMSYPVLSKLKTLQSITPTLALRKPVSPSHGVRGAIIAIEGFDQRKVLDMTNSIAEQLEKEGKFFVHIFAGPDSYKGQQRNLLSSGQEVRSSMTTEKYLKLISEWHKVSKEMSNFITQKPENIEHFNDQEMTDASTTDDARTQSPFDRTSTEKSPISSISPRTVLQPNYMNLDTPKVAKKPDLSPRITRSRIPQAALDQQKREADSTIPPPPPPPPDTDRPETPPPPPADNEKENALREQDSSQLIPVALVPHYQLTTVDTCSIALPITDNYDPLTHWRWHATLWRGCVGPDISVVITSPHEQQHEDDTLTNTNADNNKKPEAGHNHDQHRRASSVVLGSSHRHTGSESGSNSISVAPKPLSSGPPPSSSSTPFGVEVRLQDHRAVIVRAASSVPRRSSSNTSESTSDKDLEKENENWEKAKRRVGFEVEEWMRR